MERKDIWWCIGRLEGLSGTVRYELDDKLRKEIAEVVDRLKRVVE